MLKAENKEYQRPRRKDMVPDKKAIKSAADYAVKKSLAAEGDYSGKLRDSNCLKDV